MGSQKPWNQGTPQLTYVLEAPFLPSATAAVSSLPRLHAQGNASDQEAIANAIKTFKRSFPKDVFRIGDELLFRKTGSTVTVILNVRG